MFSFELTSSVQLSPPKNDSGKRVPEQATSGGGGEGGSKEIIFSEISSKYTEFLARH
jgi:hypothetical protein